ncbi:hypothetical protein [Nitrosomonas sp.]|uniref:hypothetical protein n=1 Tax=Nitrosomonas sp. TaxID=42353 RepID=UPI00285168D1|nr:hypothetical protein [Nitrosomonas sp.]MDR4513645.1 hypothetical protein [Nitrosomonas sp.]
MAQSIFGDLPNPTNNADVPITLALTVTPKITINVGALVMNNATLSGEIKEIEVKNIEIPVKVKDVELDGLAIQNVKIDEVSFV